MRVNAVSSEEIVFELILLAHHLKDKGLLKDFGIVESYGYIFEFDETKLIISRKNAYCIVAIIDYDYAPRFFEFKKELLELLLYWVYDLKTKLEQVIKEDEWLKEKIDKLIELIRIAKNKREKSLLD